MSSTRNQRWKWNKARKPTPQIYLIRTLANIVPWRIIVARDEPPTIVASNSSATDMCRVAPNHLCVVETLPTNTRVGGMNIVGSFIDPKIHGRTTGEIFAALGKILTVWPISRVDKVAVPNPLPGIVTGKIRHFFAPHYGPDPYLGSGSVVNVDVVLSRVLP